MSEPYANGLRLYQQERYDEARAALEEVLRHGPDPAGELEWHAARFFAAKCDVHLGRDSEARSAFLEIVRTPDDPFRWAAAGWLCGDRRTVTPPRRYPYDPECAAPPPRAPRLASVPADALPSSDVYAYDSDGGVPPLPYLSWLSEVQMRSSTAYLACGDGRHTHADVTYVFGASGTLESVRAEDEHHASLAGTPLGTCIEGVARHLWIPPFGSASYEVSSRVMLLEADARCAIGPTPCERDQWTVVVEWRFAVERCDPTIEARLHIVVTATSDGTIRDVVVEGALADGASIGSAFQACAQDRIRQFPMDPFTDPTFTLERDLDVPDEVTRFLRTQHAESSTTQP